MRILIAAFSFHPEVDGVAMAAGLMSEQLSASGHEVHVATGLPGKPLDGTKSPSYSIHRFDVRRNGGFDPEESARYIGFLKSIDADVLIMHCWDTWTTDLALKHLKHLRAKKILMSHGYDSQTFYWQKKFPWGLRSWMKRLPRVLALPLTLTSLDRLVVLSHKRDCRRFFDARVAAITRSVKVSVIPNGIDTGGWEATPVDVKNRWALGNGITFLYVANYFPGKNQQMAVEAFCKAGIPGSNMVFIGTELGSYGKNVVECWESMKSRHPDLNVMFLHGLSRNEVISFVKSCDVAIMSSKGETQPLTLLEALACGKPFISTDVGCVSEFEGGLIARDVEEMASQMRQLAGDEFERNSLGEKAKACFELNYSTSAFRQAWLKLLSELCTGGGVGP